MEQIGKVADSNLDQKINLKSNDEIGRLAGTFDDMTESLNYIGTALRLIQSRTMEHELLRQH
jgi:nitrogen fixation/metabolism regulation signal transduction histidine kinase